MSIWQQRSQHWTTSQKQALDVVRSFQLDPDGKIVYDASLGFRVSVDLIELGPGGIIEQIHAKTPFLGGSLASMSDLLLLRAVTVVDRGADGDFLDFQWLLGRIAVSEGFPKISEGEMCWLRRAADLVVGQSLSWLIVAAIIGSANMAAAMALLVSRLITFSLLPNTSICEGFADVIPSVARARDSASRGGGVLLHSPSRLSLTLSLHQQHRDFGCCSVHQPATDQRLCKL